MRLPRCEPCGGALFTELGRVYCINCGREPHGPVPLPCDAPVTEYTAPDLDGLWARALRAVLAPEEEPCLPPPPLVIPPARRGRPPGSKDRGPRLPRHGAA